MSLTVVAARSDEVDGETRADLAGLWDRAFGSRFGRDDADHAYGGVHVLARHGDSLVGHASAVPRRLMFGDGPWSLVGYVEAVAVEPQRQGTGIGRALMRHLHAEIASRWPLAMLSTGQATGFYEALGWEQWRGPSYTRTSRGIVADHEHGGLLVLRLDSQLAPDLSVTVTCEDRSGDAW